MSKKLNSMPDYQARMPRFQHDLSQSTAFTAAPAMLLPVYWHPLHLGDRVRYQGNLSARLCPIVKPALGEIDLHVDYFFVPLSVMYLPALNLFYQTDDLVSGLFDEASGNNHLNNVGFPLYDYDASIQALIEADSDSVDGAMEFGGITYPQDSFDCRGKAAFRLLDMLDLNPVKLFDTAQGIAKSNPVTTPWALCAYHAIYENYVAYRNSDREGRDYSYNFDKYYATSSWHDYKMLSLHYVDAYKDYFNSIKVSPIGASVSMLGKHLDQSNPWDILTKVNSFIYDFPYYSRANHLGNQVPDDFDNSTVRSFLNVGSPSGYVNRTLTSANVRQLFMVDKLLRVVGRADKTYEAQFLAHFGVKIPHDVLHNITHLGHDLFTMNPQAVLSTANTYFGEGESVEGSSLGEVGGQGYCSGDGRLRHFEAPCHGIFMAIFYAKPRFRYYAGVSKLHDLSSPDKWWTPEFDRKGMQPLFSYEVVRPTDLLHDFSTLNERLGWQFAYEQFKRKYDRVSRAFSTYATLPDLTPHENQYRSWVLNKVPFFTTNLDNWEPVSGESNYQVFTANSYNAECFKALPTDLNTMMEVPYNTHWIDKLSAVDAHLLFHTDPFIVDYRMNCKISNFMSEYGEPELGD